MLEYVHQWEDIRRIWTEPTDPLRARASRGSRPTRNTGASASRTSGATRRRICVKRLARGVFILWAGEIPFRYSEINHAAAADHPRCAGRFKRSSCCLALVGADRAVPRAAASPRRCSCWRADLVYITAVHFPLLTEARQSLPAQPIVLLLATIGRPAADRPLTSPRTADA